MAFVDGELERQTFEKKGAKDTAQMADKDDRKQLGNIRKTISRIHLGAVAMRSDSEPAPMVL
jgi:hypothetical protein